ncbi:hypothetical protein F444_09929 [Phytophthora nicotianae P1976]|uniref:Retrotransposon gag domain-containing protein n=1 Tax=Phytophthora nicotianae P1976 TaxID=1317066 RepID=A0A081A5Z0_PHYNI|nr:hypothetical protein F444_09929 [Phytophthora nicotianae P1976]
MAPGEAMQTLQRDSDEEGKRQGSDPEPEPSSPSSSAARRKRRHRKKNKKRARGTSSNESESSESIVAIRVAPPASAQRPAKISVKLIDVCQFEGVTAPGYVDSGARDWLALLQDQMDLPQLMTGETWTDGVKLSILVRHLRGEAEEWYRDYSTVLRSLPFNEVCNSFLEAFCCPLNSQQILDHVSRARKRPDETYKGYARRLRSMASNINDGRASESTDRQAFATFFKYTKAKLCNDLITKYRRFDDVKTLWNKTLDLCEMLAEHFGGDGRVQPGQLNRNDGPVNGKRTRDESSSNNAKDNDQRGRKRAPWVYTGNREHNQQGGQQQNGGGGGGGGDTTNRTMEVHAEWRLSMNLKRNHTHPPPMLIRRSKRPSLSQPDGHGCRWELPSLRSTQAFPSTPLYWTAAPPST